MKLQQVELFSRYFGLHDLCCPMKILSFIVAFAALGSTEAKADLFQFERSIGSFSSFVTGIAVDTQDRLYVLERDNGISRFDNSGMLLDSFSPGGGGHESLAVASNGDLFIGDFAGNIRVYDSNFVFQRQFGVIDGTDGNGNGNDFISKLAVDSTGRVASVEVNRSRVVVYDANGGVTDSVLGGGFVAFDGGDNLIFAPDNDNFRFLTPDSTLGAPFSRLPAEGFAGSAAFHDGKLFVGVSNFASFPASNPILVYDPDTGLLLDRIGQFGTDLLAGEFQDIFVKPIAFDSQGNLFAVTNGFGARTVHVFSSVPEPSMTFLLCGLLLLRLRRSQVR